MAISSLSAKLDFPNQPAVDVLSVWLRIHDSGGMFSFMMSIQIVIKQAMNFNEFNEARSLQSKGILKCQACPDIKLYPPMPNSEASER